MVTKLFSILYLLTLLFFSCQSSSNKTIQEFKMVNNSLQVENKETTESLAGLYLAVSAQREKNEELASNADKLFHAIEATKFYIDSLKQSLNEADPSGTRTSIGSQTFLNTYAGQKLKAKLLAIYSMLSKDVSPSKKERLENSLTLIKEISTTDTWNKKYIDNMPTTAVITILNKIENDLSNGAVLVLQDVKERLK